MPALQGLLDTAAAAGDIRPGVDAYDLLNAIGSLYVMVRDAPSTDSSSSPPFTVESPKLKDWEQDVHAAL